MFWVPTIGMRDYDMTTDAAWVCLVRESRQAGRAAGGWQKRVARRNGRQAWRQEDQALIKEHEVNIVLWGRAAGVVPGWWIV